MEARAMKIAVIGTGYVGLVTGTCLAESGNDVIGIDKDRSKIEVLDKGQLPIYEPGLLELVQRNRREERLRFTTDFRQSLQQSSLVYIAVGTPQNADGAADLDNIWSVADQIAEAANAPKIVIVKSTVPVGTNYAIGKRLQTRTRHTLSVVSNPE